MEDIDSKSNSDLPESSIEAELKTQFGRMVEEIEFLYTVQKRNKQARNGDPGAGKIAYFPYTRRSRMEEMFARLQTEHFEKNGEEADTSPRPLALVKAAKPKIKKTRKR